MRARDTSKAARLASLTACAAAGGCLLWAVSAFGLPGERSFTPSGLRLSVSLIILRTNANDLTGQHIMYECPSSKPEDCLVDLTDEDALAAIAEQASMTPVPVGTYTRLDLRMCKVSSDTMIPIFLEGSFTIESETKTYYTDDDAANASGLKDTAPAEFTRIDNWRCGTKSIIFPTPLTVTDGAVTDLSVVVDNELIAFSTPQTAPETDACKAPPAGPGIPLARGVCLGLSSMLPYVGTGTPTLQRFLLAHHASDESMIDDAKANGYAVVILDPAATPLIAYVRPYYGEDSAAATMGMVVDATFGGPSYAAETSIDTFGVNPDGSIHFETGLAGSTSATFDAFRLEDHVGTLTTRQGSTWRYHAIPYP